MFTLEFDGISGPSANRRESKFPVHQPSNPAPAAIKVIDLQPEVGVYPTGEDSNIIHARQVPAGLPLPQGPHGPIIPAPQPTNYAVTQTPDVPQLSNNNRAFSRKATPGPSRKSGRLGFNHQTPGPGVYQPPLKNTPTPMEGRPDSGQQLIKHYLLHKNSNQGHQAMSQGHAQKPRQQQGLNQGQVFGQAQQKTGTNKPHIVTPSNVAARGPQIVTPSSVIDNPVPFKPSAQQPGQFSPHPQFSNQQHMVRRRIGNPSTGSGVKLPGFSVRQDLAPAAAALGGAISSTLTPVSIFSNLLNAYATLDSKHDITNQIVQSASSWLGSNTANPVSGIFY